MQQQVICGSPSGSRDLLLRSPTYLRTAIVSPTRAVCAVHSMQPSLNYFGVLL